MSYTLYNRLGSGGFVVEAALHLASAQFELIELESKPGTPLPESFRATNPWGQVPTLVLPDGSTMTETSAILIHLADCFPDKHLAPAPGSTAHGAFLRWLIFANINVYEAVLRRAYPFRYTDDDTGYGALQTAAERRMSNALNVIESHIEGPFLTGADMTVADIYLAMLFVWRRSTLEAPRLNQIATAIRAHSIVGPIWRRHFGDR